MNVDFELVSCEEWIGWSKKGQFEGLGVSIIVYLIISFDYFLYILLMLIWNKLNINYNYLNIN